LICSQLKSSSFLELDLYESYSVSVGIELNNNPEKANAVLKDIGFIVERIHAIVDDLERFHSTKRNLFKLS
jgi:hypothetical protein